MCRSGHIANLRGHNCSFCGAGVVWEEKLFQLFHVQSVRFISKTFTCGLKFFGFGHLISFLRFPTSFVSTFHFWIAPAKFFCNMKIEVCSRPAFVVESP